MPHLYVVEVTHYNEDLYVRRVEFSLSDGSRIVSNIGIDPSWSYDERERLLTVLSCAVEGVCNAVSNIPLGSREAIVAYVRGVIYQERVAALKLPVWHEIFGDDFRVFGIDDVYEDPHIAAFHRGLGSLTVRPMPEQDVFAEVSGSSNYGPFSRIFQNVDQMVAYLKER